MGGPKDKELGSANTSCFVQVLGVGADSGGTVPSVLLFFDRQRYLFNAGEGFQRFCVEHKVKMSKVSAVLATRVTTQATGGLPGMLITMADTSCGGLLAGHTSIAVHGPRGLQGLVNAFRTFVNVKDIGLKVSEFGAHKAAAAAAAGAAGQGGALPPVVSNELVKITPVVIEPPRPAGAPATAPAPEEPPPAAPAAAAAAPPAANGDEPGAKRARVDRSAAPIDIPSTMVESAAACYVCELPDIPGKFLPQRAAALGVARGPLYGKLVRGEEVTSVSGRVVKPVDVMEASTPGPVVLVTDCPSEAFVAALADPGTGLGRWSASEEARSKVACVVHLAPPEVLALAAYKQWMASFGSGTTHLLVAESLGSRVPIMRKSAVLHAKLNALDPEMFALPPAPVRPAEPASPLPENCVVGDSMLRFHLRPVTKRGLDREECGEELDVAQVQEELRRDKREVVALAEAARRDEGDPEAAPPPAAVASARGDEWALTFLGTGAAIPSKYRNVTGLLLDLPSGGAALLMDCGEGSLGQLRRRLGGAGADDVLRRLTLVWISHIHADHHVGLPSLLAARTRLLGPDCQPLLVIGPRPLRRALAAYAALEPMRFRYVESAHTVAPAPDAAPPPEEAAAAVAAAVAASGLSRLESVRVVHCAHSYGLVVESSAGAGWKLVFSGDTRPCEAVEQAARGATLLVHEATFDDSMEEEAEAKKHCTTRDAVRAGAAAGAYRTLLTHFSQRYPKVPLIDENFGGAVGIAFDLMTVRPTDLRRMPALVPALKALFEEEEEEEEGRGEDGEAEPVPQMLS